MEFGMFNMYYLYSWAESLLEVCLKMETTICLTFRLYHFFKYYIWKLLTLVTSHSAPCSNTDRDRSLQARLSYSFKRRAEIFSKKESSVDNNLTLTPQERLPPTSWGPGIRWTAWCLCEQDIFTIWHDCWTKLSGGSVHT